MSLNHMDGVTRFEVIDDTGRAYVAYNLRSVSTCFQDDGKTLKVFIGKDYDHQDHG